MTKEIELTRGRVALVSDEDYERVARHKWCFDGHGYATRKIVTDGKSTSNLMHRFILEAKKGADVDHIDGNGLNNVRENLRLATRAENVANTGLRRGRSAYKGVQYRRLYGTWNAVIKVDGKRKWLGTFKTETEAARAYDVAAREIWKDFARPNFP